MTGRSKLFALALVLGLLQVAPALAAPEPMTRDAIMDLAASGKDYSYWWGHGRWRMDGAQHGSCSGSCPNCTHSGNYGADCSGFAAKVWQVPGPSPVTTNAHPYSTRDFRYGSNHWSNVDRGNTQKADCLVYRNSSNSGGHIVVYKSGDPWGSMWMYEARGCSYGIVYNSRTLSSSYVTRRRDNLVSTPQIGTLKGAIFIEHGDGSMDDRIPGATVTVSSVGDTTARADDAIWVVDAPPGAYTVTATAPGYQTNTRSCSVAAGSDTWCSIGLAPSCIPNCSGKACGGDGCGGSCGSCGADETCDGGQCVCVPNCDGKSCGGDGCGGSCGSCGADESCNAGACVCQAQCGDAVCGVDPVCGESCGSCGEGEACNDGVCECVPDCNGVECGPDPVCGTGCGLCAPGELCNGDGACVDPAGCSPDCEGRSCGADPRCGVSCGTCGDEQICGFGGNCTDIEPSLGKVYGHVYEADSLGDERLEPSGPLSGAQVSIADGPSATSDDSGYFELQLLPGLWQLQAVATGYYAGQTDCQVTAGLSIECDILMLRHEETGPLESSASSDKERLSLGTRGCASSAPSAVGFVLLLVLPLLRRRRSF